MFRIRAAAGVALARELPPFACQPAVQLITAEANDVVILQTLVTFVSIGEWYERFK